MVWPPSVKGILVTESVRGDGGVLTQLRGQAVHVRLRPRGVQGQVRRPPRRRATAGTTDPDNNRRPPELLPRDEVARAINSEVKAGRGSPARRRLPRRLQPAARRRDHQEAARRCTTSSRSWPTSTSQRADGGRPDLPLRHGRRRGRPRHRRGRACPGCSRPARSPAACTARTGSAATRCPTCWSSAGAPGAGAAEYVDGLGGAGRSTAERDVTGGRARPSPRSSADGRREPLHVHHELQQTMNDLVGIIRTASEIEEALERLDELKERAPGRQRRGAPAVQPRLAPGPRPAQHAAGLGVRRPGGAGARGEPRRPHPRRLPGMIGRVAAPGNLLCGVTPDGDGHRRGAAAAADARRPAQAVRPRRAGEVPDRGRAGRLRRAGRRSDR